MDWNKAGTVAVAPEFTSWWTHRLQAQQDQQGDGGQASLDPLVQGHDPIVVIVDFLHHFLKDLQHEKSVQSQEQLFRGDWLWNIVCRTREAPTWFFRTFTVSWSCFWDLPPDVWMESYRFEFRHVPLQVLGHAHHLGDDLFQLLQWDHRPSPRAHQRCASCSAPALITGWHVRSCKQRRAPAFNHTRRSVGAASGDILICWHPTIMVALKTSVHVWTVQREELFTHCSVFTSTSVTGKKWLQVL